MTLVDAGRTYVWAPVRARRGAASLGHGAVVVLETRHRTGLGLVSRADERVFKSDSRSKGAPADAGAERERRGDGGAAWSVHVSRLSHWRRRRLRREQ